IVERLDLDGYRYFHSTRADLLRRLPLRGGADGVRAGVRARGDRRRAALPRAADRRVCRSGATIASVHPWESLRIETPRLVLRLPTVGELHELAALARAGVHDPAEMPFVLAWTDRAHLPSFDHEFVDFHLEARR